MPRIILAPALAEMAGNREVEVAGETVLAAVRALNSFHPKLFDRICNEQNQARNHVLIYVNDDDVRHVNGMQTAVRSDDHIFIVAAVSGG